jgi:hypothetical protein
LIGDELFYSYEINLLQSQSFLFYVFEATSRQEEIFQILWSILSIAWIGAFWVFRDTVGNFVFSIFQWIKGKI